MTVEPSCPRTPSGRGKCPARSQITNPEMIAVAMARLAVTTRRARRDRVMTARDGGEVITHDHRVGGVQGEVGSGPPHRDAGVRGGQGRGVVDAIPGEQHVVARCLEPLDRAGFVLGQEACADVVDSDLPGLPPPLTWRTRRRHGFCPARWGATTDLDV
jgi:hypothetical protein